MTPEAQRIAIAKVCGWEWMAGEASDNHPSYYGWGKDGVGFRQLPDYISDLNAMHEAEKRLGDGTYLWDRYCDFLGGSLYHCAHATAAKRAEAFLKTLNLWKDEA